MAYQIRQTTATIPASTPKATPVTIPLAVPYADVVAVTLTVLSGPNGLMGFQLWIGGGQWIPYDPNEYLVWDDVSKDWALNDQPAGTAWSVVGYNLDAAYGHAIQVGFHINPVTPPASSPAGLTVIQTPPALTPVTL